jgi:hypothetical protein
MTPKLLEGLFCYPAKEESIKVKTRAAALVAQPLKNVSKTGVGIFSIATDSISCLA